jgi:hypothetical protein
VEQGERVTARAKRRRLAAGPSVLTAALVADWRSNPDRVPPEWRGYWDSVTAPAVDDVPWSDEVPEWVTAGLEEPPSLEPGEDLPPSQWDLLAAGSVDPLDAVSLALAVVQRAESDLAGRVAAARAAGASWSQVGAALATSKQAAQQRYGR